MFTSGFKFFFGLFVAFTAAALIYGYASGGGHTGPISLGWKGGVGEHIGYGLLTTMAFVALGVSLVLVAFRDADAEAQANLQGVDDIGDDTAVSSSWWPTIGALGIGTALMGLVLHPVVFVLGLVMITLCLIEWTMDAWTDRATGDAAANRALRSRIMTPIEIPVAGAIAIGVVVLAASRIFLTVSALGAVIVGGAVSAAILIGAALYAAKPGPMRKLVSVLGVLGVLALFVAGILSAVRGEREFHHHDDSYDNGDLIEEGH